ncbi:MAG: hypothetical protein ACREYE_28085 [Gammaproteobacteria bacterium]
MPFGNRSYFPGWNNRFQEFDPLLLPKDILTDADIAATFGGFLDGVKHIIEGDVA